MKAIYKLSFVYIFFLVSVFAVNNKNKYHLHLNNQSNNTKTYLQKLKKNSDQYVKFQSLPVDTTFTDNYNQILRFNTIGGDTTNSYKSNYFGSFSGYPVVFNEQYLGNENESASLSFPLNLWNSSVHKYIFSHLNRVDINDFMHNDFDNKNLFYFNNYSLPAFTSKDKIQQELNVFLVTDGKNMYIYFSAENNLNTITNISYFTSIAYFNYNDFTNNKNLVQQFDNYFASLIKSPNYYLYLKSSSSFINNNFAKIESVNLNSENQLVSSLPDKYFSFDENILFKSNKYSFTSNILISPGLLSSKVDNYNTYFLNNDSSNNFISSDYTLSLANLNYFNFQNGNPFNYHYYTSEKIAKIRFSLFAFFAILSIILVAVAFILYFVYLKSRWAEQYINIKFSKDRHND